MPKSNKPLILTISIIFIIAISIIAVAKLYRTDINSLLPVTVVIHETDEEPKIIAYRILFEFMQSLKDSGEITNAYFTRFTKMQGDENSFLVAADLQVQLQNGLFANKYGWGKANKDRMVDGIIWLMTIEKEEDGVYTLTHIERSSDRHIGLPAVETVETDLAENNSYKISNGKLLVTYSNGEEWIEVPVIVEELFEGTYDGSKDTLIDGSYVISPEKTAFVVGGFGYLRILFSNDAGKTWEEAIVSDQLPVIRLRIVGFTSETEGYLIVTGDKTMNFEMNMIFKSNDGGNTWHQAGFVEATISLVTDGGFVTDQLGFLSFGSYNTLEEPPQPFLFRTNDGGKSWEEVEVPIPDEYKGIFTIAEIPTFDGNEGTLLVNQGPAGDYMGGKVLAKFTSEDEGKTWTFTAFVDPENVFD